MTRSLLLRLGACAFPLVLLLGTSAVPAQADEPQYQVTYTVEPEEAVISEALGSATFKITASVAPTDTPLDDRVQVTFTFTQVSAAPPAGWSAPSVDQETATAAPGDEVVVNVTVSLTQTDVQVAEYELRVQITSQPEVTGVGVFPAGTQQSDTEFAEMTAQRRLTTAETITTFADDNKFWLLGLAAGILLGGVLLVRRKKGIHAGCDQPSQQVIAGRGASFPIHVVNPGPRKETLALRTSSVPEGWSVLVPLDQIELEPGTSDTIWATIKSPMTATAGLRVNVDITVTSLADPSRQAVVPIEAVVVEGFHLPVAEPRR